MGKIKQIAIRVDEDNEQVFDVIPDEVYQEALVREAQRILDSQEPELPTICNICRKEFTANCNNANCDV